MPKLFLLLAVAFFVTIPSSVFAADELEVSGWIPYWRSAQGTADARRHLDELTEVNPFGFSVRQDGTLNDLANITNSDWKRLIRSADRKNVEIVPTIMWSDGAAIHTVLSDRKLRTAHVKAIANMVKKGKYDGVDIDYEAKRAETKDHYSQFLKELRAALGSSKILSCTTEARTPPDSLYRVIPANIQYANDFKALNRYCDQVKLMTYDQGRADIKLNDARTGEPYIPIADVDWVEKVVDLATKDIDENKIMLGVATYGREYDVTVSPNWFRGYRLTRSLNPGDARITERQHNVTASRNAAGELSYSYIPAYSSLVLPESLPIPRNTPEGHKVAARALAYANMTGATVNFNLVWWSDAEAIEDKIELAKEKGLRGISIFKIDGEQDPDMWDVIEEALEE